MGVVCGPAVSVGGGFKERSSSHGWGVFFPLTRGFALGEQGERRVGVVCGPAVSVGCFFFFKCCPPTGGFFPLTRQFYYSDPFGELSVVSVHSYCVNLLLLAFILQADTT